MPLNISGTLYEGENRLLIFESLHAGLGSFLFIPDHKKEYHIRLEGDTTQYALPGIQPVGQIMRLLPNTSDTLGFLVAQNADEPPERMYIRIQIRGVVYGMAQLNLNYI